MGCKIRSEFLSEKLSLICTRNNCLSKTFLVVCCFGRTKLLNKLRFCSAQFLIFPNQIFLKEKMNLCFARNIPSQRSGGRVLPVFWRKIFVFPSLFCASAFFPALEIFPSFFLLVLKKGHTLQPWNSEGGDFIPCEKGFAAASICIFTTCRILIVHLWRNDLVEFLYEGCRTSGKIYCAVCGV